MKGLVISILLFPLLAGCANRNKIPSDIIRQEQMGEILWDMTLAEEFTLSYLAKDSVKEREPKAKDEFEKVLAIHQVSQETFHKSLDFYKTRPDLFKVLIDTLYNRVQRKRETMYMNNKKMPE